MPQESKFIQLVRKQITTEREYAKHLTELRKKVEIAGARLLLLELLLESEKHAAILTEMLEIMQGIHGDAKLWDHANEEYINEIIVRKEFENHLKKEGGALAELKEEVKKTKNDALKLLFRNIEEDEKRHHGVVQALVKNLYKME
jgi:rubrerythrin